MREGQTGAGARARPVVWPGPTRARRRTASSHCRCRRCRPPLLRTRTAAEHACHGCRRCWWSGGPRTPRTPPGWRPSRSCCRGSRRAPAAVPGRWLGCGQAGQAEMQMRCRRGASVGLQAAGVADQLASARPLLQAFCGRHFPAGPAWNAAGIPASQFKPGAASAAAGAAAALPAPAAPPKAPGGPPPPPPPPPPGSLLERKPAANAAAAGGGGGGGGGNPMAALFADINKGGAVTAGLRKVTGACHGGGAGVPPPACCCMACRLGCSPAVSASSTLPARFALSGWAPTRIPQTT